MKKPPHSVRDGVFTWALIIDTFAYGICIGITCLMSVSRNVNNLLFTDVPHSS